jgi:hypothetical protein
VFKHCANAVGAGKQDFKLPTGIRVLCERWQSVDNNNDKDDKRHTIHLTTHSRRAGKHEKMLFHGLWMVFGTQSVYNNVQQCTTICIADTPAICTKVGKEQSKKCSNAGWIDLRVCDGHCSFVP